MYSLSKSVGELCDKAYNLSLVMRSSSKATFRTIFFSYGTLITPAIEAKVSCQGFDGQPASKVLGSKIAMTICCGLEKIPHVSPEATVVLERSHIVCYV